MSSVRLILPYPPTTNHLYATVRGHRVKSLEARRYATQVQSLASRENLEPVTGDVAIRIDVYRPKRIGDLDGRLKAVLDNLQGIAYVNDRQIVEIHARRFDDKAHPRVEVTIEEV